MERTLVLLKPDAVQRQLVGRILGRFEDKGFKIVALKMLRPSRELAENLYSQHRGQDFFEPLVEFMCIGPCVAVALEGVGAIAMVRSMLGATFGPQAEPGTIRGDFAASRRYNLIHGSDSAEAAAREVGLVFRPEEIISYDRAVDAWVYAKLGRELI